MRSSPTINNITQQNIDHIARMQADSEMSRTFGQRVADQVATWVGSWSFLIVQTILLSAWVLLNVVHFWKPWDAYPFILLNLVLSFQAAFATPVILMSQNRQARLTERRNHLDLQINLLSEQENTEQLRLLRLLCEKQGIAVDKPTAIALEEQAEPEQIVQQITKTLESGQQGCPR